MVLDCVWQLRKYLMEQEILRIEKLRIVEPCIYIFPNKKYSTLCTSAHQIRPCSPRSDKQSDSSFPVGRGALRSSWVPQWNAASIACMQLSEIHTVVEKLAEKVLTINLPGMWGSCWIHQQPPSPQACKFQVCCLVLFASSAGGWTLSEHRNL